MPIVKLDTGYNIEVEFAIASFGKRLLAWTIDILICWFIVSLLASVTHTDSFFVFVTSWSIPGVLITLVVLFYHLLFEVLLNGQSPGKRAVKCRVVTEQGGEPSLGQYLIRWVFRLVDLPVWIVASVALQVLPPWTFPLLFAGVASILMTPRSQRLGDLVAGTLLIDLRNSTSWQDTVFTELSENYRPRYAQVMQLSDRDINTLKNIIESVKKRNDHELARKIAQRIQSKLKMDTDQYPLEFLETLLMDYNYYSAR